MTARELGVLTVLPQGDFRPGQNEVDVRLETQLSLQNQKPLGDSANLIPDTAIQNTQQMLGRHSCSQATASGWEATSVLNENSRLPLPTGRHAA
jgi:hypothetical protein